MDVSIVFCGYNLIAYIKIRKKVPGTDLLLPKQEARLPSALKSLTAVFGMGTGVSSLLLTPGTFFRIIYPNNNR